MNTDTSLNWIADGEKYALVGLSVKTEGTLPQGIISPRLSILTRTQFEFPSLWKEWIGTIRSKQVESSNLFLLSKIKSEHVGILDGENRTLEHLVSLFYAGLVLASPFSVAHKPVRLTGSRRNGEVDVRSQADFEIPVPNAF